MLLNSVQDIEFEELKNREYTCRVKVGDKWKYVYSRYRPQSSIKVPGCLPERPHVLLGLGLGYEALALLKSSKAPLYVIENHASFIEFLKKGPYFQGIFDKDNLHILNGEAYQEITERFVSAAFIQSQTTAYDPVYYSDVVRFLIQKSQGKSQTKVVVINHPTIADNCIGAFKHLNYAVKAIDIASANQMAFEAARENPDYFFSISPHLDVLKASKILKIPYIFWNVDTPHYQLYYKKMCQRVLTNLPFSFQSFKKRSYHS